MKSPLFVALLVCMTASAFAQTPQLLKDINTNPADFAEFNYQVQMFTVGDYVLFQNDLIAPSARWWISDGTAAGTHAVDENAQGIQDTYSSGITFNGSFYYNHTPQDKSHLMKYTPATSTLVLVKDFDMIGTVYAISNNGQLIFALTSNAGTDLWKSDGTTVGTVKFATLDGGSFMELAACDGTYSYFVMQTFQGVRKLWRTDGTESGTLLLKSSDPLSDEYSALHAVGNELYFSYAENFQQVDLWKTDGTMEGTEVIYQHSGGLAKTATQKLGDKLITSGDQVYTVDLTNDDNGTLFNSNFVAADQALIYNSLYYFVGFDFGAKERFLGKTDGTPAGSAIVTELGTERLADDKSFFQLGSKLLLSVSVPGKGEELGISDGTEDGTILLKDIFDGATGSYPRDFAAIGSKMLFTAIDAVHGRELWITDGTEAGTMLVKELNASTADGVTYSSSDYSSSVGGKLVFPARFGSHDELWISDGTEANTKKVYAVPQAAILIGNLNGDAYYAAFATHSGQIIKMRSTGEYEIVKELSEYFAGIQLITPNSLEANGKLFFMGYEERVSSELWVTDGTADGTHIVKDINPSGEGLSNSPGAIASGKLFFTANDGTHGNEIWASDGTEAGTAMIKDITEGTGGSNLYYVYNVNNKLCFFEDNANGKRLWSTDGTLAGTQVVYTFPFETSVNFNTPVVVGNKLLFGASKAGTTNELWQTDGTTDGTKKIKSFEHDFFYGMYAASDKGFFTVRNDIGMDMWVTDGTEAGTKIIDMTEGSEDPAINKIYGVFHGMLYFARNEDVWKTGGTSETTIKVADGLVNFFVGAGEVEYFGIRSPEVGFELYTLPFSKIDQAITFGHLDDKTVGDADFTLSASANSGLPITFTASPSDKVTIANNTVTILKPGKVTLTAAQPGNDGVEAATSSQTICLIPAKPTLTLKELKSGVDVLQSSETNGNLWYLDGTAIDGATAVTYDATEDGSYTVAGNVDDCLGETSDAIVVTITGLEEEAFVSVFPNPAKEKLYVQWHGNSGGLSLSDAKGIAKVNTSFADHAELSLVDLPAGFYILKLSSSDKQVIRKFIKE